MQYAPAVALTIGAAKSGSGKTTVTLALLAALTARGHTVQSFKTGPDTLDLHWHSVVTKRPGYTLDAWFSSRDGCRAQFHTACAAASKEGKPVTAVVEGVMGLFDGLANAEEFGSTAQMAGWLGTPVLLVLDASSQGRSIAALAHGFTSFDPQVAFAGILCNNVGSARHEAILAQALKQHLPHIPALGFLPKDASLSLPSRHLGLALHHPEYDMQLLAERLTTWVEQHADLDSLLAAAAYRPQTEELPLSQAQNICLENVDRPEPCGVTDAGSKEPARPARLSSPRPNAKARVGIANDVAFCFGYRENLNQLVNAGAELVFFSPLHDKTLPEKLDGLIYGGGYPELHAAALSQNRSMLEAVREFCASQRPVLAEGGGFMYLMRSLTCLQGNTYAMAGVFPLDCKMHNRLQALGYRETTLGDGSLFGPGGTAIRGHQFHYSALEQQTLPDEVMQRGHTADHTGKLIFPGVLVMPETPLVAGSHMHFYLPSCPSAAAHFVDLCARCRASA